MSLTSKVITCLAIAAVWGWFADLKSGEVSWFVGRLLFAAGVALLWHLVAKRQSAGATSRQQ
jgi:hypothetical protein